MGQLRGHWASEGERLITVSVNIKIEELSADEDCEDHGRAGAGVHAVLDPVLRDVHLVVGAQDQRRAARLQAPEAALGLRLPQQLPQPPPLQDGGQIQVLLLTKVQTKLVSLARNTEKAPLLRH